MNYVLDACAMIAFLRDEQGADVVAGILRDGSARCYAHSINLCEVYYDFVRSADIDTAGEALRDLRRTGVVQRQDMSGPFWKRAGELKATLRQISLADCFAVALAERIRADVVTSDRREFAPVAARSICPVRFIR